MIVVDNDAFRKLCWLKSFEDALDAFGRGVQDVYCLSSMPYKFYLAKQNSKGRKRYGAETHAEMARLEPLLTRCTREMVDESIVQELLLIEAIDEGEAQLIALTLANQDSLLWTGDKRCLVALGKQTKVPISAINGRVFCLEQLVRRVAEQIGLAELFQRPAVTEPCDTALTTCMRDSESFYEGIDSYIADLRNQCPKLLA